MAVLNDVKKLLSELSPSEKQQILKWILEDLGGDVPGIESRPDVCGGEPCIVRTRIPVWPLAQARRAGVSEEALLEAYPSLRPSDLINAWAYEQTYREQIDRRIRENAAA